MDKLKKKFLLDRSIFHGTKFKLLNQSNLKTLTQNHFITIYGNPILLEETSSLWFKNRKEEAKKHIQYIIEITNGRWFNTREETWKKELESLYPPGKYFFMSATDQKNTLDQICKLVLEEKMNPKFQEEVEKEKDKIFIKSSNIKKALLKMRRKVSNSLKKHGKKRKDIKESFNQYYTKNIDWLGEQLINTHLNTKMDKKLITTKWKQNKSRYPYFTLWGKAFLYMSFHAMAKPNEKVDQNAIMDIGQLVYLKDLDAIVSDDIKFMKDAFIQLYGKDKAFLTSKEFIDFIKK